MNQKPLEPEKLAFLYGPDATFILEQRIILRANLMSQELFGWSRQELEGQSIQMLYPAASDFHLIGDRTSRAMTSAGFHNDERFMRHKAGHAIWVEGKGRALDPEKPHGLAIWIYRPLREDQPMPHNLTAAEMRVARYLVNGYTSKEAAASIGCSFRTVEVHRAAMIRKLGLRNSSELIRYLLGRKDRQLP